MKEIGSESELKAAIRIRELMAKVDSGEPFWVWDDTMHAPPLLETPDRVLRCYVGEKDIGSVKIWFAVPMTTFAGSIIAHAWQGGGPRETVQFDGAFADRLDAAKEWVITQYYEWLGTRE